MSHEQEKSPMEGNAGNPYAAPESPLPDLPSDAEIADAVAVHDRYPLLANVVGRNFEVYARRWHLDTGGSARPWHWPALFFDIYWMLYRKMYLAASAYLVAAFIAGGVIAFFPAFETVALIALFGLKLLLCVNANVLYRWHCQRLIARLQTRFPDQGERLQTELGRRGGTSVLAVIVGGIIIGGINVLAGA
jgi:hypothetical protein